MVPKGVVLRPARAGDQPALGDLMFALWPEEGRRAFRRPLGRLRLHVCGSARSTLQVAVDRERGEVVGFVAVGVRKWSEAGGGSPIPHVEGWFVTESWRRRGVGRALLRAAEGWAKREGFRELSSDTWAHNTRSIKAHQRSGFRLTERIVYFLKRLRPAKRGSQSQPK